MWLKAGIIVSARSIAFRPLDETPRMAKIQFKCACGKLLAVDEQHAGKIAKCPACHRPFQIPEARADTGPNATKGSVAEVLSQDIAALTDKYQASVATRARKKRVDDALREQHLRTLKRNLILAASGAGTLLVVLLAAYFLWPRGPSIGSPDRYPPPVREFLGGLSARDPRTQAAATWEIANAGGSSVQVITLIGDMTKAPNPLVRLAAIQALLRIDRPGAPPRLEPLLHNRDLDVRMTAAFALARCSSKGLTPDSLAPLIARTLDSGDDWLPWLAEPLAEGSDPAAFPRFLDTALQSTDPSTRAIAAWIDVALLADAQRLLPLLRDPDPAVVTSTIHALAPLLTAEAFEELRKQEDPEELLRQRFNALQNVALRLRNPEQPVRIAAALAIADNAQSESAYLLAQGLKDSDWFVRFACLKGLELLPPALAKEVIDSTDGQDRDHDNIWIRRVLERITKRAHEPPPAEEK